MHAETSKSRRSGPVYQPNFIICCLNSHWSINLGVFAPKSSKHQNTRTPKPQPPVHRRPPCRRGPSHFTELTTNFPVLVDPQDTEAMATALVLLSLPLGSAGSAAAMAGSWIDPNLWVGVRVKGPWVLVPVTGHAGEGGLSPMTIPTRFL